MIGLSLAAALVAGLVWAAATRPERQQRLRELRLSHLARLLAAGKITRDQVADGVVLSRKLGLPDLVAKFESAAGRSSRCPHPDSRRDPRATQR